MFQNSSAKQGVGPGNKVKIKLISVVIRNTIAQLRSPEISDPQTASSLLSHTSFQSPENRQNTLSYTSYIGRGVLFWLVMYILSVVLEISCWSTGEFTPLGFTWSHRSSLVQGCARPYTILHYSACLSSHVLCSDLLGAWHSALSWTSANNSMHNLNEVAEMQFLPYVFAHH